MVVISEPPMHQATVATHLQPERRRHPHSKREQNGPQGNRQAVLPLLLHPMVVKFAAQHKHEQHHPNGGYHVKGDGAVVGLQFKVNNTQTERSNRKPHRSSQLSVEQQWRAAAVKTYVATVRSHVIPAVWCDVKR